MTVFSPRWLSGAFVALCALSTPLTAQGAIAQGAIAQGVVPIDCAKATKPIERTLCANADVRARDEQLSEIFASLLGYIPHDERESVQKAQATWLAERDRVCEDKDKAKACTTLYDARIEALSTQNEAGQERLAAVISTIPKDAKAVASALQRYDGAAAKAWLIYLYHSGAVPVADKDAEVQRLADGILKDGLPNDPYLLEEMKNIGDVAKADTAGMLLFLRHVLSTTEMDAPCFLFTKHGQPAFESFGPFWGAARDDTPELCHDVRSIYEMPEWKKLESLIDPTIAPALAERGGISHGYERQFAIDALQASMVPSTLLEAPHSPEAKKAAESRDKAVAAFRNWHDHRVWPEAQYKAAVVALPAAISATAKFYQEKFGLAPKIADQAAHAAADRFIASRMALLTADEAEDD